jgi:hypothetical protein
MIDPQLVKIFLIVVGSGSIGSLIAMIPVVFQRSDASTSYGTTAGIGFLVGASLGGLFGVFAVLLGQV